MDTCVAPFSKWTQVRHAAITPTIFISSKRAPDGSLILTQIKKKTNK
jgi:hypothetical protein